MAPRRHNQNSFIHFGMVKRFGIVALFVFPFHGAVSANGEKPQAVFRFPFGKMQQPRPHTQGKFIDPHTAPFCQQEVSHFVRKDDQGEQKHANDDKKCCFQKNHLSAAFWAACLPIL